MDKTILQEFVSEGVTANDMDQMNEKYKVFRREWIDRMVEYMLQELNLNEEGAREARKHPEDFHINYDTYKLFVSSQSLWYAYILYLISFTITTLLINRYYWNRWANSRKNNPTKNNLNSNSHRPNKSAESLKGAKCPPTNQNSSNIYQIESNKQK